MNCDTPRKTEMKKSLVDRVVEILRENPDVRLTPLDLARKYIEKFPDTAKGIVGRSNEDLTDERLIEKRIYRCHERIVELGEGKVKIEGSRPRKYYYTEKSDEEEIEAEERQIAPQREPLERELYDGVVQFLRREVGIYCIIIDDRKSSNSQGAGGNKWLHPDIVGLGDLSGNWQKRTKDYGHQFGNQRFQLWSFEVKKKVNRYNVREAFFQAVSNSSWANRGYLVGNFSQEALDELRILSPLHGIGIIQYNSEEADDSNGIEIQAREKNDVDWGTVNRLLNEKNKDFDTFMENVSDCHKTGKFPQGKWDTVTIIDDD